MASEKSNGDRLSGLPDSILRHILSFLDTKYAVKTSVLSSRWRDVWKSLSLLSFDKKNTPKNDSFVGLVNEVLILRDISDIQIFRLLSIDESDVPNVYKWILAAIGRNVRVIDINMSTKNPVKLPNRMFTCPTLTTLKLSLGKDMPKLEFPNRMSLPNLKLLQLISVSFGDIDTVSELISSCPSLVALEISLSNFDVEGNFIINAPKLKSLEIQNGIAKGSFDLHSCKIRVFAPNLRTLSCDDYMTREYSIMEELSHLEWAVIIMEIKGKNKYVPLEDMDIHEEEKKEYVRRMTSLLEAVRNVEYLQLNPWMLLVAFEPRVAVRSLSLQFPNLKRLKLETRFSRDCALAILHLLKTSPNIETLNIQIVENSFSWNPLILDQNILTSENIGEWWEMELSNECMFHHLKDVEIQGIVGCMTEVKLVEIVLKKATLLERMVVCTSAVESPNKKKWLINLSKMLLKVPRASSNITLLLV